jgi:hypothetical protein
LLYDTSPFQTDVDFILEESWALCTYTAEIKRLSRLQDTGGLQVGEHLDDVLGHGGRSGEVVTGGLETVFIGGPVDGDDDTIGRGVRVRSLGDGADILGFRSNLLLAAALGDLGAISAFETVKFSDKLNRINYSEQEKKSFAAGNLLERIAAISVHFAVG